jgi:hypothetical protein
MCWPKVGRWYLIPLGITSPQFPEHSVKPQEFFAYGGGADFPLLRHVALRAEYRGLVYSAPDFGLATLNTNTVTQLPSHRRESCSCFKVPGVWRTDSSRPPDRSL